MDNTNSLRRCLREPIPQIVEAAQYLDAAVSAHIAGDKDRAADLIRQAEIPEIRDWTESLWGKDSPYTKVRVISETPISEIPADRPRMPSTGEKAQLRMRDGYHCRFCGIPLIRAEVRQKIRKVYSDALPWGNRNGDCHAAFQAMWLQYDHVVPFKRGGSNDISNMVITCAPCNFGKWNYTLDQLGLLDPRDFPPVKSNWDGLERFRV